MTAERDLLDEGWLCRTIADETGCKDDDRVLDAARIIAKKVVGEIIRLRARECMAAEVLRLVPRARGDHRAGCPAGINPQAVGIPQGTRRCTCHVDPVRLALGEPTTEEETR